MTIFESFAETWSSIICSQSKLAHPQFLLSSFLKFRWNHFHCRSHSQNLLQTTSRVYKNLKYKNKIKTFNIIITRLREHSKLYSKWTNMIKTIKMIILKKKIRKKFHITFMMYIIKSLKNISSKILKLKIYRKLGIN